MCVAVGLVMVIGSLMAAGGQTAPRRMPAAPVFNGVLFEEHVRGKLADIVKGYAFAVADRHGAIQARAAGGWAQAPSDGNVRMSTTVVSGLGSVTKMMSGAALLHLFERHALANTNVEAQLDTPMLSKLPEKWRFQWRGRNLERITYRHLLQHKSGFRDASCGGQTLQPLEQLAAGVKIADVGTLRCYNNFNFYLLRYLITAIAYPGEAAAIHKKYDSLSLEEYTKKVNIETSLQYGRFMRDEFFPRSLDRFVATCRPQKELSPREAAKGYANKDDTSGAFVHSRAEEMDDEFYCASQGSWYASAEGLALFGRNLLYTDRWVSPSTRAMMFEAARSDDRFPWAGTVEHEEFGKEMGQAIWPSHGGSEGGYRAALVQLPYGYVGAALINSGDRDERADREDADGCVLRRHARRARAAHARRAHAHGLSGIRVGVGRGGPQRQLGRLLQCRLASARERHRPARRRSREELRAAWSDRGSVSARVRHARHARQPASTARRQLSRSRRRAVCVHHGRRQRTWAAGVSRRRCRGAQAAVRHLHEPRLRANERHGRVRECRTPLLDELDVRPSTGPDGAEHPRWTRVSDARR